MAQAMTRTRAAGVALLVVGAMALAACGDGSGASTAADGGRLRVVTTVAPLTNIVANVAGPRAVVEGLVPEGTNSHTFEPPPSAA
jgi:ABC-type Zn uptake system ZnuABC Zn-binding protein ZnuA